MQLKHSEAIGMFDSGIGGLTVMQQIVCALPRESIIYFGDTARLPYGDKSKETIIRYSLEIAEFLIKKKIKLLIIPCNTATAYAIEELKKTFNIPILGVIEPGVEKVVQVSRNQSIAVLGTRATINSGIYQKEIKKRLPGANVQAIACPLFVPFVEEHFLDHPATKMIVKEYLGTLKDQQIDTILLGCTHYPLLRDLIQEEMGSDVAIVDSATTCAEKAKSLLTTYQMHTSSQSIPSYQYYVSDDPDRFMRLGKIFLGAAIEDVRPHSIN